MQNLKDLELLLKKTSVPIIIIETQEERRILSMFDRVISHLPRPLFRWTVTEGLKRLDVDMPAQFHNSNPVDLLTQIKMTNLGGIYLLLDFHPFIDDPVHIRLIKDIIQLQDKAAHTLVFISHELEIHEEIKRFCVRFELSLPDRDQLENMIKHEAQNWSKRNSDTRIVADKKILDQLIKNLLGLPLDDAKRLIKGAIQDDGVLNHEDLTEVMQAKFKLLSLGGVLTFEYDTARFNDIGGLNQLKEWLHLRKAIFSGAINSPGLDPPKGIMLLGVQGCGKSLAAKAVAGAWGVPLLRLDFGSLYNKYYGESEKNLRESLKTAETMAPCILWIDEIEKGITVGENDGGTSRRILGTLLTWMAENKKRVFMVATANDIESLPPELVRKGRLDEIFFVDLPDSETRQTIFAIHLKKHELDPASFNLESLAKYSEGFSGSEIEQAVVSALYLAYAQNTKPGNAHIIVELKKTKPLSVVMAERIQGLRTWAKERTVMAN